MRVFELVVTLETDHAPLKKRVEPGRSCFQFGRAVAHFAVDNSEVRMCAELAGKRSWYLPFNLGYRDGAGNPDITVQARETLHTARRGELIGRRRVLACGGSVLP
jgi:hypothetical protein